MFKIGSMGALVRFATLEFRSLDLVRPLTYLKIRLEHASQRVIVTVYPIWASGSFILFGPCRLILLHDWVLVKFWIILDIVWAPQTFSRSYGRGLISILCIDSEWLLGFLKRQLITGCQCPHIWVNNLYLLFAYFVMDHANMFILFHRPLQLNPCLLLYQSFICLSQESCILHLFVNIGHSYKSIQFEKVFLDLQDSLYFLCLFSLKYLLIFFLLVFYKLSDLFFFQMDRAAF